jgi:acetyl-CoA C-acetyltransferase
MAPHAMHLRNGVKMGGANMVDTMMHDALTDAFYNYLMGNTAENVAKQWQLSRDEQDEFRRQLAEQGGSRAEGRQVQGRDRRGHHQGPQGRYGRRGRRVHQARRDVEGISKLRPAFDKEGTVTAANASGINDGAPPPC